jgi:hypothetical protein
MNLEQRGVVRVVVRIVGIECLNGEAEVLANHFGEVLRRLQHQSPAIYRDAVG